MKLSDCTIEDILPHLLVYSSMATIDSKEKMWVATSMLVRFLETFTNNLVAMENDSPVGMLGGHEVLKELAKNPTHSFFSDLTVRQVMNKNLYIASPTTKVSDLLKKMQYMQRDFALVQNEDGGHSTVSARRLLEVGVLCDTRMKVSDIPAKSIPTFNRDDTIETIVKQMLQNDTEILILENTPQFVNPQIIFKKIVELNYLDSVDNFFDLKATALNLKNGRIISENTTIPEMCKIMLGMKHSFVMTLNNVLTPWDLVLALS
ncbi:MAG: CBS domain-containing protein [Thaumarchaeota archaeon]|nr:CBS domain-containing protein [Nitrososphaerota archaeon]